MPSDGFCPKCGAVLYNGMCQSCGHGGRFSGKAVSDSRGTERAFTHRSPNSGKRNNKIGVVVAVAIALFIAVPIILFAIIFSQVTGTVERLIPVAPQPEYEAGSDSWLDGWDEEYEEYVPSPLDEYYETFVSATVRGLSYDIAWNDSYLYADDEEVTACFGAYYPVIIGADAPFADDINALICDKALSYQPDRLQGDDYLYVECYVTYMSEEVLSVLFDVWGYQQGRDVYELKAMNFDMTTGELLTPEELLPASFGIEDYRKLCEKQNGYASAEVLEGMSDEAIREAILDPEAGVIFYSPVGVDAGFNYDGGWLTVTLKVRSI